LTHRILIIDDEAEVRDFLGDLLTRFGHHADSTGSGSEALTMLAERSYALIPTDLRMPTIAGEVLYQTIAQRWPHLASRVVFVTGEEPFPSSLAKLFGAGDVPVLRKPFTFEELRRLVERMLIQAP
jgi:two-component system NtrC family sensor kinase